MNFFSGMNYKNFPVANVVKRGRLQLGDYANIDCVNALQGKKEVRLVSFDSFLVIVGISPKAPNAFGSLLKFLSGPNVRTKRADVIVEKLLNGHRVKIDDEDRIYIDYRVITDFCRLMSWLRNHTALPAILLEYAQNCERFMLGLADVGLAAMIDEATGYDKIKRQTEYQDLFRAFIREEHSDWVKEFPDSFFDSIYKVYRLEKTGKNHPSFFGGIINKYIYYPLANSRGAILRKLQEKDPVVECKGRRYKLHQFLTDEIGKPMLRKHINQVEALLIISSDKSRFKRHFQKLFPQPNDQLEFDFGDDI